MKTLHYAIAACTLSFAASVTQAANLLANGDFENQPNWGLGISGDFGYTALTGAQLPGWTIEAGHAVTIHNTNAYPVIAGGYSVNMDGEGHFGNNANFYQDVASSTGSQYTFSFQWSTWVANSGPRLDVSITDAVTSAVLYHGNFASSAGTLTESATFTGTGNILRLRVREAPQSGFNDNTFMVDNFSLSAAPVPEPHVLSMMLGGLALVGLARARRRRA